MGDKPVSFALTQEEWSGGISLSPLHLLRRSGVGPPLHSLRRSGVGDKPVSFALTQEEWGVG